MTTSKGSLWQRSLFRAAVVFSALLWAQLPPSWAKAQEVSVMENVSFSDAHDLRMDVYMPSGEGPFPGVMVIHGGGWFRGDKSLFAEEAQYLAERGLVAFAISYRLAPENPFPAALEDVQTSVEFVREHSEEFNLDPDRVAALGGSAGGHLAAMLATVGEGARNEGSRVAAAVSWSGPMDLEDTFQLSRNPQKVAERMSDFLDCDLVNLLEECQDVLQEASPITHVDPTDAPLFLTNAEREPIPLQQAVSMAEALEGAGVEHRLVEISEQHCHSRSCENLRPSALGGATVIEASAQWLEQWLQRDPEDPRGDTSEDRGLPVGIIVIAGVAGALVVILVALAAARRRRPRGEIG